jgi:hypothetical protein
MTKYVAWGPIFFYNVSTGENILELTTTYSAPCTGPNQWHFYSNIKRTIASPWATGSLELLLLSLGTLIWRNCTVRAAANWLYISGTVTVQSISLHGQPSLMLPIYSYG